MEKSIIVAGGCFWCVEHDLLNLPGVLAATSGYSGDTKEKANYKDVCSGKTKHREVVLVSYDDSRTTVRQILDYFLDMIDPTDPNGQFADRGYQYHPVVYYNNEEEKEIVKKALKELDDSGIYDKPVAVYVEPRSDFYPAEEYHQGYASKNKHQYDRYKAGSGRSRFQERVCQIRNNSNNNTGGIK